VLRIVITSFLLCSPGTFRVVFRSSRLGARFGDGQHKPSSKCALAKYDDVDDITFEVLPSPRPQDACSFNTVVTLDTNLACNGRECDVSTVRVVEVMPGKAITDLIHWGFQHCI
jgi:hypothetical protein